MPAPPPGLSPAAAAVIIDGRAKRQALTTALVDLAARGEISFRAAENDPAKLDIDITVPDQRDARLARNRRQPWGRPRSTRSMSSGDSVAPNAPSTPTTCPSSPRPWVASTTARGHGRRERLVQRGAGRLHRPLVAAGGSRAHRRRRRRVLRLQPAQQRPAAGGRGRHRRRGGHVRHRPHHAPADDGGGAHVRPAGGLSAHAAEDAGAVAHDGPGRRAARRCPGWRRRTRPSSGPTHWACTRRPRRSSSGRWRTCAPAPPRPRAPTSHSGTASAHARLRASAAAAGRRPPASSPSGVVPDFTAHDRGALRRSATAPSLVG